MKTPGIKAWLCCFPLLGCGSGDLAEVESKGAGTQPLGWEQFLAQVHRDETGVYVVNGDEAIGGLDRLRDYYESYVAPREQGQAQGSLAVYRLNGVDVRISPSQQLNITYCVSSASFGTRYSAVVSAMHFAAEAWELAANVDFVHLSQFDGNCTPSQTGVLFDVNQTSDTRFLARAFFPNDSRPESNILISTTAFGNTSPVTLTGILRHELGHVLGFRHEHTRPEAGTCLEDGNWRALTSYDRNSVMHYPQCNGGNTGDLGLTALDHQGAGTLYGFGTSYPNPDSESQGAGLAFHDLNGNGRPDMLLMSLDNPPGDNSFRYRIGWDVNARGIASSWSTYVQLSAQSWEGQGAGVTFTQLDTNPRPEVILVSIDNPTGANTFRYRIGWNMDTAGNAVWSNAFNLAGVGDESQGAGVASTQLDADPRPELVFMGIDNPTGANTFRYRIAWNVTSAGTPTTYGNTVILAGAGDESQGGGIAIANLDGDARPDFVFMGIDNPPNDNTFRYRVAWNVTSAGNPTSYSSSYIEQPGLGWEAQEGDVALQDLNGDGRPELFLMANDNPPGVNYFRWRVVNAP
jgi:hypothetical protein